MRSQEVNVHPVVADLFSSRRGFSDWSQAVGETWIETRKQMAGHQTARIRPIVGNRNFGTQPIEVAVLGRAPATRKMWPKDVPNEDESKVIEPVRFPLLSPGLLSLHVVLDAAFSLSIDLAPRAPQFPALDLIEAQACPLVTSA